MTSYPSALAPPRISFPRAANSPLVDLDCGFPRDQGTHSQHLREIVTLERLIPKMGPGFGCVSQTGVNPQLAGKLCYINNLPGIDLPANGAGLSQAPPPDVFLRLV